ncbi:MAG TPA: hypothetical protein PK129_14075, partial [Cellvibrionaceae bacterium]|nr:hypothetical protein [Cellvibrionaceae bacterium]
MGQAAPPQVLPLGLVQGVGGTLPGQVTINVAMPMPEPEHLPRQLMVHFCFSQVTTALSPTVAIQVLSRHSNLQPAPQVTVQVD